MSDNSIDHMTIKYKVVFIAGIMQIKLESGMKPQSASGMYEVSIYGSYIQGHFSMNTIFYKQLSGLLFN